MSDCIPFCHQWIDENGRQTLPKNGIFVNDLDRTCSAKMTYFKHKEIISYAITNMISSKLDT